jgi:hypothetical protein
MSTTSDSSSSPSDSTAAPQTEQVELSVVELDELAEKILDLLRKELFVDNERSGRYS